MKYNKSFVMSKYVTMEELLEAKGKYRHPQFKQLRYDKAPEDCKG